MSGNVWFISGLGGVYAALRYSGSRGTWALMRCGSTMQVLLQLSIEAGNFVDWNILHCFKDDLVFLDFGLNSCKRRHLVWCQFNLVSSLIPRILRSSRHMENAKGIYIGPAGSFNVGVSIIVKMTCFLSLYRPSRAGRGVVVGALLTRHQFAKCNYCKYHETRIVL